MSQHCPHCGAAVAPEGTLCAGCREALHEAAVQSPDELEAPCGAGQGLPPGLRIIGIDRLTAEELACELERGARFVVYEYCVSTVILSSLQPSPIYFIPHDRWSLAHGL